MDAFRISLIVVGVSVLVGIYLFDSKKKIRTFVINLQVKKYFNKSNQSDDDYNREPEINDESEILEQIDQMDGVVANPYSKKETDIKEQDIVELTEEISVTPTITTAAVTGEEMVVVFFIVSKGERYFSGVDINNSCLANGFKFSDKNTYEMFSATNLKDTRPVASIVNSFEPGIFDSDLENFDTKAITIILFLPGPDTEMAAFNNVMNRAKKIATSLSGELCDETRSVLTQQTISHLEEKIEAFQFKNKMQKTSLQY